MATSYSANQYNDAFASKHLQSWQISKSTSERPKSKKVIAKPLATADGRVLFQYNRENSFKTNYINTWDMPKHLPGSNIDNPMARDAVAYEKLKDDFSESKLMLTGQKFNYRPVGMKDRKIRHGKNSHINDPVVGVSHGADTFEARGSTPGVEEVLADEPVAECQGQKQETAISNKIPLPDFTLEIEQEEARRNRDMHVAAL